MDWVEEVVVGFLVALVVVVVVVVVVIFVVGMGCLVEVCDGRCASAEPFGKRNTVMMRY